MNHAKPARVWTFAQYLAGMWLACAVTGCALVPDFQKAISPAADTQPRARLEGVPPDLAARASALIDVAEPAPRSVLEASNRVNQSSGVVRDYLSSEGYLGASVETPPIGATNELPVLLVEPGPRFKVLSRTFNGREALVPEVSRRLDEELRKLPEGAVARATDIERMESALVTLLRKQGYAFARSEGIDALASRAEANVELTFLLVPGPRVSLGSIAVPGADARSAKMVGTLKTWSDGSLYTPEIIEQLRARLRSTGLYDGIGVVVSPAPGPDGLHEVSATLVDAKPRSVGFGVSASTTEGLGVDGFWERRNLTGRADHLRVQGEVATLAQNLTTTYERPNIGRYGRTFSLEGSVRAEETDAYDLQGVRLGAALAQPISRELMLSVGGAVDATRTFDQFDQITLSVPVALSYSDVGDPLDPQSGVRFYSAADTGVAFGDGTTGYTRLQVSASTYQAISENIIAAIRAEYGAFAGSGDVPPDRLFFAGGGGTVRGYEYQSLSPRNAEGDIIGGRALFAASAELRWRASERFGYAMFADLGAASDDPGAVFSETSASVGLGVRYYPGFGPIRFDLAAPLDRRSGDAPVQVYVSIGQSF